MNVAGRGRRRGRLLARTAWRYWRPRLPLARLALLLGLIGAADIPFSRAHADYLRNSEVPVIAFLVDSHQILTDQDRTRLAKLANDLPFTPNFMICVLQSVTCTPPEAAHNDNNRSQHIRHVIDNAGKYARNSASDGVPRTQDISRVVNDEVGPIFVNFWKALDPEVGKGDRERQVWIVLVSPETYFDVDSSDSSDLTLHNAHAPDVCFVNKFPPNTIEQQARLRVLVVMPNTTRPGPYPDSGVHTLGTIFRNIGGRLDAIYQVILDCPENPNNFQNWVERSASANNAASCIIERGENWTAGKPRTLSCVATVTPTSPRTLREMVLNGDTGSVLPDSPKPPAPVPPLPAPPPRAPSPNTSQQAPAPPAPSPQPNLIPQPAPSLNTPHSATSQPQSPSPAPSPQPNADAPPAPPAPNTQHAATSQPQTPPTAPNPVPQPPAPARNGPDPRTVTALADAQPAPVITGTLVTRPMSQDVRADAVVLEFTGNSGGFDLGLRLIVAGSNIDAANGTSSKNRLVINSPPSPGLYRIIVSARPRNQNCSGGRDISGTVAATGRSLAPIEIALKLQVSHCAQVTTSIVVGTLEVK